MNESSTPSDDNNNNNIDDSYSSSSDCFPSRTVRRNQREEEEEKDKDLKKRIVVQNAMKRFPQAASEIERHKHSTRAQLAEAMRHHTICISALCIVSDAENEHADANIVASENLSKKKAKKHYYCPAEMKDDSDP